MKVTCPYRSGAIGSDDAADSGAALFGVSGNAAVPANRKPTAVSRTTLADVVIAIPSSSVAQRHGTRCAAPIVPVRWETICFCCALWISLSPTLLRVGGEQSACF